ncbi:hypothetical protein [Paenibacillus sinensis]|uniref:hypothetical protein n=1 Tax=Paenibacillus sinensis TaxID=2834413 RepID=UPI001CA93E4C|nr:hypothetical protein [Paenibacillus sinensis]
MGILLKWWDEFCDDCGLAAAGEILPGSSEIASRMAQDLAAKGMLAASCFYRSS